MNNCRNENLSASFGEAVISLPSISVQARMKSLAWRGGFLLIGVLFLFSAIAARLVDLQYFQHEEYAAIAQRYQESEIVIPARRGAIIDSQGRSLALSFARRSCAFDPQIFAQKNGDLSALLFTLRDTLKLTPAECDAIFTQASRPGKRFVWVKRLLTDADADAVEKLRLPGIMLSQDYQRYYPQKTVAAAVLGFTDIDGRGLEGIEKAADALLRGVSLRQEAGRDALGRKLLDTAELPSSPLSPLAIELTLDSYVQLIAEEELAKAIADFRAVGGCAVVMDMRGDILAMAGLPTFDANHPTKFPTGNRLIRAIATSYEPGSIFKPFVVARALDEKAISLDSKFFCENGAWSMPGVKRVLHDTHPYGSLDTAGVLIKSSNIGIAKIAGQLGMEKLSAAIRDFGFGAPSGIALAGEIGGKVYPFAKWTAFSSGSIPMGQEIATTPLQMTAAWCAIANGGELYRPRLIKSIRDGDGELLAEITPEISRRVITAATSQHLRDILRRTVEEGTGKHARSDKYNLGGKTGTAQQSVNAEERARGLKGYSPSRYIASFVAIAPIAKPEIVVMVSINEPEASRGIYGGTVAAPATRAIAERVLQYRQIPPKSAR